MPGLHWHLPYPIEIVDVVNIEAVNDYEYSTEMLTADEQYVFIDMVVQYRRTDPVKYSFEVEEPDIDVAGRNRKRVARSGRHQHDRVIDRRAPR